MIEYASDVADVSADDLVGFFVGWPLPPAELVPFYERVGLARVGAAVGRHNRSALERPFAPKV